MKFFIPATDTQEDAERVYASIKSFIGPALGATFSERRVYNLRWNHEGTEHSATVGQVTSFNDEIVVAILYEDPRNLYHVCTPNRGVLRGHSILAGGPSVTSVGDFEREQN